MMDPCLNLRAYPNWSIEAMVYRNDGSNTGWVLLHASVFQFKMISFRTARKTA